MNKWIRFAGNVLVMTLLCTLMLGKATQVWAVETEESTAATVVAASVVRDENGLTATQAMVYDTGTEEYLFQKSISSGKVYPASITKLFSAFVALQYMDGDTRITAGSELDFVAEDASVAVISEGQTLTVSMLVEGMLLPSGNDASYILATATGRKIAGDPEMSPPKAVQVFVDEMNSVAKSLGLRDTRFMNPDGYHMGGHYSSVPDLLKIAQLALEDPVISQYVDIYQDDVVYVSGETNSWKNTNELLNPESDYYREDACGLKTGYTSQAGNCLISAFRREAGYIIVGVFGCEEPEQRFEDTITLIERFG